MVPLKEGFVSSVTHNSLPHISDVSHVPDDHFSDLQELRALLVKYKVPRNICIRLIHKHFDINAGEAMVIKTLDIPTHGTVSVLRPTEIAATSGLHGIHFLVDANGLLQPYEYSSSPPPDVSSLEPFFTEFCRTVIERGLQRKLGLKISRDIESDKAGWTEFEFPEDRSTIMIPKGLPTPEGEYEFSVETEFHADPKEDGNECSHTRVCIHCSHPRTSAGELSVGAQRVEPGTPFHGFFNAVVEVW